MYNEQKNKKDKEPDQNENNNEETNTIASQPVKKKNNVQANNTIPPSILGQGPKPQKSQKQLKEEQAQNDLMQKLLNEKIMKEQQKQEQIVRQKQEQKLKKKSSVEKKSLEKQKFTDSKNQNNSQNQKDQINTKKKEPEKGQQQQSQLNQQKQTVEENKNAVDIALPILGEKFRDIALKNFKDALLQYFKENNLNEQDEQAQQMLVSKVVDIEETLYNKYDQIIDSRYKEDFRTLWTNMKDPNNPDLRYRIFKEEITMKDLVTCDLKILLNEKKNQEYKKLQEEMSQTRRSDYNQEIKKKQAKGGGALCRYCKSSKTSVQAVQTRSADEGMTEFFECLDCGKKWKC